MGGKAIGDHNMPTDLKKKFEQARASGNIDQARAIADNAQKYKEDKKAAAEDKKLSPVERFRKQMSQKGKEDKAKAEEGKKSPSQAALASDPITGFNVAKKLGINGVRKTTKPEVMRKKIESHIAGENASRYLKAGIDSGLPQYKGVSESSARDFAEFVHGNKFAIDNNIRTFDGRGVPIAEKLVTGGILRPANNRFVHELTPLGRELAKNVITDLSTGRVKKQADSLYAGN